MTFINAGANKGYQVAEFLQRFHSAAAASAGWRTNADWLAAIKAFRPHGVLTSCGVCMTCQSPAPAVRLHAPSVRVHAFELTACNHWLLKNLFERLSVPGIAHHVAVTNRSGLVYGPARCGGGDEGASALMRNAPGRWNNPQPATSVDDFCAKHGLDKVHWLAVDTEGFDALVLEGAQAMLASRKIDVVEFEYHDRVGYWRPRFEEKRTLKRSLDALHAAGYECFWQGNDGRLASVTPAGSTSWCSPGGVGWSNLVCSSVPRIVANSSRSRCDRATRGSLWQGCGLRLARCGNKNRSKSKE